MVTFWTKLFAWGSQHNIGYGQWDTCYCCTVLKGDLMKFNNKDILSTFWKDEHGFIGVWLHIETLHFFSTISSLDQRVYNIVPSELQNVQLKRKYPVHAYHQHTLFSSAVRMGFSMCLMTLFKEKSISSLNFSIHLFLFFLNQERASAKKTHISFEQH